MPRGGAGREHGPDRRPGDPRSVVHPDLRRLLLLRLPARLHHRALPGLRRRGLLADPGERRARQPRDHHDLGARGGGDRASSGSPTSAAPSLAGALGARYQKKYLLAQIYLARTIVAAAFILAPMTPGTVLLFSVLMGALWLATVPLTSGLVAADLGPALHGHALRHRLLQPPARRLHGRLARRPALRHLRRLHAGLVDRRRRRRLLGARPPADPRAAGGALPA